MRRCGLGCASDPANETIADAEQILGLGDWGIGGIEISIGKLAIYTAAGGIDPRRVIPVMLDVGTNRESLLKDPMYIGNRHVRVRGKRYDAFIDAYVAAVTKLFPNAAEPLSAPFNRQQLGALGRRCDVELLATVPWFPGSRAAAKLTGRPPPPEVPRLYRGCRWARAR